MPLLAVVIIDMIREIREWLQPKPTQQPPTPHPARFSQGYRALRILFPILVNLTISYVAITVLSGRDDTLQWLVWVIVFLLIRASMNAWNMMIRLAMVRKAP